MDHLRGPEVGIQRHALILLRRTVVETCRQRAEARGVVAATVNPVQIRTQTVRGQDACATAVQIQLLVQV